MMGVGVLQLDCASKLNTPSEMTSPRRRLYLPGEDGKLALSVADGFSTRFDTNDPPGAISTENVQSLTQVLVQVLTEIGQAC